MFSLLIPVLIARIVPISRAQSLTSPLRCPGNAPFFSTAPCSTDTTKFRCPPGYRCRPAQSAADSTLVSFICCASTGMIVANYFVESDLSPKAVPRIPLSMLRRVVMADQNSGKRIHAVGIDAEVSGVDPSPNNASFSMLDAVDFRLPLDPSDGHFVHLLVAARPLARPSSLQLYFDYPSFANPTLNLTEMDQRSRRGFVEFTSNETLPFEEYYRTMFVVLAWQTEGPLLNTSTARGMDSEILKAMQQSHGDLGAFLSSELVGKQLDAPIAGTFFHLTTRNTTFKTAAQQADHPDDPKGCGLFSPQSITLLLPLLFTLHLFN